MPDTSAISLVNVSKTYRLYTRRFEQAMDVMGLSRLRFWRAPSYSEHPALKNINLGVKRGERLGILGRNGAGKTTLLKLITGNFAPTSGTIEVNGQVQALMNMGLGFHPEFSGYENIRSSLAYNALSNTELERAVEDIVEFVELDEYLHQPMKTYSLGMQARVMFAAATAIKPDVLIVDEVLGAGDAYFSAKSAHRMDRLAKSGCTLLLVSHNMQQILQFCDQAIWLEGGSIVKAGEALPVVKAYEEFADRLQQSEPSGAPHSKPAVVDKTWFRAKVLEEVLHGTATCDTAAGESSGLAPGGVSRWVGNRGLKIAAVRILNNDRNEIWSARTGDPLRIEIEVVAEESGNFSCRYVVLLFTADGRPLSRHLSEEDVFYLEKGQKRTKVLHYPELSLGNGEYVFSAAVYKHFDPLNPALAVRYDLLSRSFSFKVTDKYEADPSLFHHPSVWR